MPVLHSVNVKAGIFYGIFSGYACRWVRNAMPDYDSGYIRESGRKTTDDVRNDFSVVFCRFAAIVWNLCIFRNVTEKNRKTSFCFT